MIRSLNVGLPVRPGSCVGLSCERCFDLHSMTVAATCMRGTVALCEDCNEEIEEVPCQIPARSTDDEAPTAA